MPFDNTPRIETAADFGAILMPEEAQEPILSPAVRGALMEWLTEIWAKDELLAVGLEPRHKALFDGPPGVGKTTLAHHLAARLGLPLLAVRPERIVDCWVGSSERNIGALFDAVEANEDPLMMFFDEFDSLAFKRRAPTGTSADEGRNAMVNTLLSRIEGHPGYIIAATNFGSQLDHAIWRRFDIQLTLDLPQTEQRERILARYLAPFGLPKEQLRLLSDAFATATPALMRQFCEGLKRQIVIGPKVKWNMARDVVIARLLAAVAPHPDLGKPRLWSHGVKDAAVRAMDWPLPLAKDIPADPAPARAREGPAPGGEVIPFSGAAAEARTP